MRLPLLMCAVFLTTTGLMTIGFVAVESDGLALLQPAEPPPESLLRREAAEQLIPQLQARSAGERRQAADALAVLGADARPAVPALIEALKDDDEEVRVRVAQWTGEYQYTINQVIDEIGKRCRELNLRLAVPEEQARVDFTIFVAVQTMHYLHSGRHRVWL